MIFPPEDIAIPLFFFASAWMFKAWLDYRTKIKGLSMPQQGRAVVDERLGRLEQAVESIAIEIERVSEGQRYVTKLMSDRAQPQMDVGHRSVLPRRVDTPH